MAVELLVGTDFPIGLTAGVGLELPKRLLLRAQAGWMPPAYLEVINDVSTGFDWYSDATAALIEAAVDDAFILRLSVGWRPFENEGFELTGGYTLLLGGGGVTSTEAIEAATGQSVNLRRDESNVPVDATLHAIHAAFSWRWLFLEDHLVFRVGLGFVYTLDARVQMKAEDGARGGRAVERSETYVEDTLETYGFTPELQLGLGYRF
ncbi:MAG TPA: hypothetical protein RMF84_17110 [Polyangiaceae bacterium LLY-WYZ-14_1]|nr:hypothetical protein [Polyangiaceae bacterium LLY-WYZ-14_1]